MSCTNVSDAWKGSLGSTVLVRTRASLRRGTGGRVRFHFDEGGEPGRHATRGVRRCKAGLEDTLQQASFVSSVGEPTINWSTVASLRGSFEMLQTVCKTLRTDVNCRTF